MQLRIFQRVRFPILGWMLALATIAGCDNASPQASKPHQKSDAATPLPSPSQAQGKEATSSLASEGPAYTADAVDPSGRLVLGSESSAVEAPALPAAEVPTASDNEASPALASNISADSAPAGSQRVQPEAADAPAASDPQETAVATAADNVRAAKALPAEANVATDAERHQTLAPDWPEPQAVLFVSGQQHGYIEPCGCTGLENQKGGLIRRDTLLQELRQRGWEIIPIDVGNQVRRIGRQPELKFQTTVDSFRKMGYRAAALGIDDLKLSSIELIQMAGSDGLNQSPFLSANVTVVDESFFPSYRVIEVGGRKIGITAVLGNEHQGDIQSGDIQFFDAAEKLKVVADKLQQEGCDFKVLLAHASIEGSAELARQVPGFDLVVTAGGFGEPTYAPEPIEGSKSLMVQVGTKGMYGGIVGLFDDPQHPVRYQRIAISSQFKDSKRMLEEFALYQKRLADAGLEGLGVTVTSHPTGRKFVGSEACSDCHSNAYAKWQSTPHSHATTSIIEPDNERGGIPRHHDPECISCHATGWNAQKYYPYETGFRSPEETPLMMGSGCENCHGPGSDHVAAELGEVDVTSERLKELQQQMVLPLDKARDRCLECHDLDNSPSFHVEGAFDEFWEQVKHYGKD